MSLKNIGLALGVVTISTVTFAQKKNETSAAVERGKALTSQAKQDMETAKKQLLSAKQFIDLAATHEDTKNNQKTLWLKGDIYSGLLGLAQMTGDLSLVEEIGEEGMNDAIASLKKGYGLGKKYKGDIVETVDRNRVMLNKYAGMLYNAEKFKEAAEMYAGQAEFADAIEMLDTSAVFNAALCYEKSDQPVKAADLYTKLAAVDYRGTTSAVLASSAYRKAKQFDKAKAIIAEARKKNPTDRELLLESVNTSIDEGDAAGAEAALNAAISTDPNNKQLHYTIGTIYIDLGKNAKAEEALNKSLEIDPNYVDAQYQLGAHLVTWAGNLKTEAKKLKLGDPKYDTMIEESNSTYKRALIPLEKYIASYPNDKAVLNILFQLHRNLGNSDKALEYKKRADAAE